MLNKFDEIFRRQQPTERPGAGSMALYHYLGCPFCSMVSAVISQLGLDIEMRDIYDNPQHQEDLVNARGRATVPVLRVTGADGEDTWMPESRDIVRYLEDSFGGQIGGRAQA